MDRRTRISALRSKLNYQLDSDTFVTLPLSLGPVCILLLTIVWGALDSQALAGDATRIMCLGDSITRGSAIPSDIPGGYRTRLYSDLTAAGYSVDFVGASTENPDPVKLSDPDHNGYNGWRIDQIDNNITNWLGSTSPAVVLLHIGTNDAIQNYDFDNASARLDNLIKDITTLSPQTHLVVAQTIISTDSTVAARLNTYNSTIPDIVAKYAKARQNVTLVNMAPIVSASNMADYYHPNKAGYDAMGDAWFGAIKSLGSIANPTLPSTNGLTVDTTTNWASSTTATLDQIRSDDLIDNHKLGVTLENVTHSNLTVSGGSSSGLNDGVGGNDLSTLTSANTWSSSGNWTTTFTLKTDVNTAGYDISEIHSFSAWADMRVHQKYEVLYSTVSDPTNFISLGIYSDTTHNNGSYMMKLTRDNGLIASGVKAIRFNFRDPTDGSDSTVYQEIDLIGVATAVPEPMAFIMLASGMVGLLAYAWRKRK